MSTLAHHGTRYTTSTRQESPKDPSDVIRDATCYQSHELATGHHHVGAWTPPPRSPAFHSWVRAAVAVGIVLGLEVGHAVLPTGSGATVGAAPLAHVLNLTE
jgi:hypothetical protein